MNQTEFLDKLSCALKSNGIQQIEEILADYKEHFAIGLESGKSENEISQKLGEPDTIAKAYKTDNMIRDINNPNIQFRFSTALNVLGRLIILAPFNFLVLSIPGAILVSLLIFGWTIALTTLITGPALILGSLTTGIFAISTWTSIAYSCISLSLIGFSILVGYLMYFLSKNFILACISYLQWNLKFILQK